MMIKSYFVNNVIVAIIFIVLDYAKYQLVSFDLISQFVYICPTFRWTSVS